MRNQLAVLILIASVVLLVLLDRGTKVSDNSVKTEPAKVEPIQGTDFKQVTLTAKAAERLGIKTVPVREEISARTDTLKLVVPYDSIIYGLNGETWVYINPKSLVFVRSPISIDYIVGDFAILSEGPTSGTKVVTVGVAQLYGIDTGIGK